MLQKVKSAQHSFRLVSIILLVCLLGAMIGSIFLIFRSKENTQEVSPSPNVTSFVKPTNAPTVTPTLQPSSQPSVKIPQGKLFTLTTSDGTSLGVTYQLPSNVSPPAWANEGHYYLETLLPGHSTFVIEALAPEDYLDGDVEKMSNSLVHSYHFTQHPFTIMNRQGVELTGTFTPDVPNALNLLSDGYGECEVVLVKVNKDLSLELMVYQDKFTDGKINFASDQVVFHQILATFQTSQ